MTPRKPPPPFEEQEKQLAYFLDALNLFPRKGGSKQGRTRKNQVRTAYLILNDLHPPQYLLDAFPELHDLKERHAMWERSGKPR